MKRKSLKPLMSSKYDEWCTPDEVVDLLHKVGPIVLDPCSNTFAKTRASRSMMLPQDGLSVSWVNEGITYVNPPYGSAQIKWIKKARHEASLGASVLMLVPARTDTKVWHEEIFPYASSVLLWKGRITFAGAPHGAPFPSAIILFGGKYKDSFERVFRSYGSIVSSTAHDVEDVRQGVPLLVADMEVPHDASEGSSDAIPDYTSHETTFGVLRV